MSGQWDITGWKEELIPVRKYQPPWPTQATQESDHYRDLKSANVTFTNEVKFRRDTLLLHAAGWCTSYITSQLLRHVKDYGTGLAYGNIHELVTEITKGVQSDPENNHFKNIFQINQGYIREWEP